MAKMSYIAYLIEHGKDDEPLEEVSGVAQMLNKSSKEVADGFKEAFHNIKKNKDQEAFEMLNIIQNNMLEHENKRRE